MPCPSCGHTMQAVAHDPPRDLTLFWCPRCGTIRWGDDGAPSVPSLVTRCRRLEALFPASNLLPYCREVWEQVGIAESIKRRGR